MDLDANTVMTTLRMQMAEDYSQLQFSLALARAEAAQLRQQVAELEEQLGRMLEKEVRDAASDKNPVRG